MNLARTVAAAAMLALSAAACSGDSEPTPVADPPAPTVVIDLVSFGESESSVTLANRSDDTVDLAGTFLCQDRACLILTGTELSADARLVVTVEHTDVPLDPDAGELYVLKSVGDRTGDGTVLAYVAWGDADQPTHDRAVAAGVWPADAAIPASAEGFFTKSDEPRSPDAYEPIA